MDQIDGMSGLGLLHAGDSDVDDEVNDTIAADTPPSCAAGIATSPTTVVALPGKTSKYRVWTM